MTFTLFGVILEPGTSSLGDQMNTRSNVTPIESKKLLGKSHTAKLIHGNSEPDLQEHLDLSVDALDDPVVMERFKAHLATRR